MQLEYNMSEEVSEKDLENMSDEDFLNSLEDYTEDNNTQEASTEQNQEQEVETTSESEESNQEEQKEEAQEEKSTKDSKESEIDYKSAYQSIFKPFKANGKEITPHSVNDVVSLMQMGANYTKKMQTIAPMKKTIESLNTAKIDENELNFLIDVHNGDREAIKTLLKRHNIESYDLDLDSINYKPNNNIVSDEQAKFSEVLDDVSDNIGKITEIVNKKWDNQSRDIISKNPELLKRINEEINLGRFDQVQSILDEERMYGRYNNVSDIEAYSDIITKIVKYQNSQKANQYQQQKSKPTQNVPDKTKAAPIHSKTKNQGRPMTSEDIFSMSDEEFNKLSERDLF